MKDGISKRGIKYKKISDTHYLIQSRSDKNKWYHVTKDKKEWRCGCPAGVFNKCTHIKRYGKKEKTNKQVREKT